MRPVRGKESRVLQLAGALLLVTVLSACTSDGAKTGENLGPAPTTTDVPLESLNPRPVGPEAGLQFLGSKEGPASGEPVRIGFINQGEGEGSAPEALNGAVAAVAAINKELGGVRGRPIELLECVTKTGESEAACAKNMTEAGVVAVVTGRTPVDPVGMTQALAGIPVTGVDPRTLAEEENPSAAYYTIGRRGIANTAAQWLVAQSSGTVLVITDASSGEDALITAALQPLKRSGRNIEKLQLPSRGAENGSQDTEKVRSFLRSSKAEVILLLTGEGGCVAVAEATQESETLVVTSGTCSQRGVHAALGDWTPSWVHVGGGPDLVKYDQDEETAYYRHSIRVHVGADADWTGLANSTFSAFMNLTRALNQTTGLDRASVILSMQRGLSRGFAAGRPLRCGVIPTLPARCLNQASLYEYDGGRNWKLATGGARVLISE